jgi:hypothetical protein
MPTTRRPWRRDAWRWAVKYGAIIGGVFFLYHYPGTHGVSLLARPTP